MESNLLLLLHHFPQPCCCFSSIILPPQPQLRPLKSHHHLRFSFTTKHRRWHSNAETFHTKLDEYEEEEEEDEEEEEEERYRNRRRKRQWWSDGSSNMNEKSGILDQVIDCIWIFKVFKSYGWYLPAAILSLLLATGLKSFLMALALPLGQSLLSLAFEKLWGRTKRRPKHKTKTRRKPSASTVSNVGMEEEEQEESQETRKGKMGYQSWVGSDNGSVNKGGQDTPSFGGWEELDRMRSRRGSSQRTKGPRRRPVEKSKLSRSERSEAPLLLRLLIAVFPFLGSWTKML